MAGLRCNIVTPTESVLESEASYIEFPAWDGQKGVAPGAAPFLVRLGMLMRTPRGRVATAAAWRHAGLEPPGPDGPDQQVLELA